MTATQLPKRGDRFVWVIGEPERTIRTVTEHSVFYEWDDPGRGGPGGIRGASARLGEWLKRAIPIPPKPHVEPVQWGIVYSDGRFDGYSSERVARGLAAAVQRRTIAKLAVGVLWLEVGGEFVRAFEDGAG